MGTKREINENEDEELVESEDNMVKSIIKNVITSTVQPNVKKVSILNL